MTAVTGVTSFRHECAGLERSCGSQKRPLMCAAIALVDRAVGPHHSGMGPKAHPLGPGQNMFALAAATYQQQGSMPAQQAAPATQQEAANAVTENAEALIAATALM